MWKKIGSGITAAMAAPTDQAAGSDPIADSAAITSGYTFLRGRRPGAEGFDVKEDNELVVGVLSTAGSGAMTATVEVWGYVKDLGKWFKFQALNGGNAIPIQDTARVSYGERVLGFRHFDWIYVRVTAVAGTTPSYDLYLGCRDWRYGL